jgi:branched-chain amino acid transport system substrate-binding protein
MKLSKIVIAAAVVAAGASSLSTSAIAQAKEQFFPLLSYRTGPYAPNGTPWANGKQDYIKMINARDGGINGVKLTFEECETGYATDRGVECYERLKSRPGVSLFDPQSTGITFALTEKAPADKIPLMTLGYGLSVSQDGMAFKWNFPFMGSYWTGADILIQHIGKNLGGMDKLKGKKIALVYHDSPFGKEPIPLLQERAKMHGFELQMLPVTAPGVEQKATWLQVRQSRPDYVLLWGWGVMNSTALKEAQATGYPRDKMYGVWWAGAEPDVRDVGEGAKGYNALALNGSGTATQGHPGHSQACARQGPGHRAEGRGGLRAVHPWRDHSDAEHRSRAPRPGALRQGQGHDWRASALGHGEPGPGSEEARCHGFRWRDASAVHQLC